MERAYRQSHVPVYEFYSLNEKRIPYSRPFSKRVLNPYGSGTGSPTIQSDVAMQRLRDAVWLGAFMFY